MTIEEGWSAEARRRRSDAARRRLLLAIAVLCAVVLVYVWQDGSRWLPPLLTLVGGCSVLSIMESIRTIRVQASPRATESAGLTAVTHASSQVGQPGGPSVFALRHVRLRRGRMIGVVVVPYLVMAAVAVVFGAPVLAVAFVIVALVVLAGSYWSFLRKFPLEVRVDEELVTWQSSLRTVTAPVAAVRRMRCNTTPAGAVVIEFEGQAPMVVYVIGGFADFLRAMSLRCPWMEVDQEVIDKFGAFSTGHSGFFAEGAGGHA